MSIFLMGTGEWGLEAGEWGMENRELIADSREWGMGARESGMGDGGWGLGIMVPLLLPFLFMNRPVPSFIGSFGVRCSLICSNLRHPVSAGGAMRSKGGHISQDIR